MIWIFLAALGPALVSFVGTELVRRYAIKTSMVDVPNDRSSHTAPTPRGGGIAIVAGIVGALCVLVLALPAQRTIAIGILGGGGLIAAVGLLDDRFGLSAKSRLLVHFVAAAWLLTWIGGIGDAGMLGIPPHPLVSALGTLVAVVFLVWCTNLYNFMDGIDGFAGSQALIAAMAAAFICWQQGDGLLSYLMLATAGAAAGFLVWNWPPAKIFMGDCGSGFLGFLFGAVVLAGWRYGSMPLAAGAMLIIVFLGDATLTLLRRIRAGEAWYKPHRSHAYQLATQLGASHRQVTICALAAFSVAGLLAAAIATRRDLGTLLIFTYAIVLAGIWMLINQLFVGRRGALASINTSSSDDADGEFATVVYLRMRQFQTRMKTWRSSMPRNDLLTEVTGVASDLGYTVSHDWLDGCGGGRCEIAGEKWILLDFNMSRQDQVRQILLAIHEEVAKLDEISTDLRMALVQATAMGQAEVRKAA